MKKSLVIVIVALVIVIVVLAGLHQAGKLFPSSGASSQNPYAPNVVASSQLNSTLGGKWTHESSGYGSAGNLSDFLGIVAGRGTAASAGYGFGYSAAVSTGISNVGALGNISSFEFSIFSPDHSGFAAVGVANYNSVSSANNTFNALSGNVSAAASSSFLIAKGDASGNPYVYVWTYANSTSLAPHNQYLSALIGIYSSHLIGIFYLTPDNLSQANFTSLYEKQVTELSSMKSTPTQNVFVTSSELGSYLGGTWQAKLGLFVQINNAQNIIGEFSGLLANATQAQRQLINQTVGNLSQLAVQGYVSGSFNQTVLAFAKFQNDKLPYTFYLDYLASVSSSPSAAQGNVSGAAYVFTNISVPSIFGSKAFSISLLVSDYNDYLFIAIYHGSLSKSQAQFENLLKGEIAVI